MEEQVERADAQRPDEADGGLERGQVARPQQLADQRAQAIIDYLVKEFEKESGIDIRKDPLAMQRLKEAAEKAKADKEKAVELAVKKALEKAAKESAEEGA